MQFTAPLYVKGIYKNIVHMVHACFIVSSGIAIDGEMTDGVTAMYKARTVREKVRQLRSSTFNHI